MKTDLHIVRTMLTTLSLLYRLKHLLSY